MDVSFSIYELDRYFNETIKKTHFVVVEKETTVNIPVDFSSSSADKLYADDS